LRESQWHGHGDFDAWMAAPINNAKLLPFGLYRRWVPAFAALFAQQDSRWPAFFAAVAQLARRDGAARAQALTGLQATSR
jgi:predicted aminopeptidase